MTPIPTVDDLASDALTHRFGDFFNPPGLTNFRGCVQVETDITAISSLSFPPLATAKSITAAFVFGGRHFQSLGVPVTIVWSPDKIVRTARWNGFRFRSTTTMVVGSNDVLVVVDVTNDAGTSDEIEIGLNFQHTVSRDEQWDTWLPEIDSEADKPRTIAVSEGVIVARNHDSTAASVNAVWPKPDRTRPSGFRFDVSLNVGETWRMAFVTSLTDEPDAAISRIQDRLLNPDGVVETCRQFWNDELAAIFTPGNDRFSGHLPVLETDDTAILKLYWMGAVGLAYFKRDSPFSAVGRAYDTLMPRFWQTLTCIWDYFLSSPAHVLLEPALMRLNLERWMGIDLHQHFGTEYLKGEAIGPWYAVNDSAMVSMIHRYAFWSGDKGWLAQQVGGQSVAEHACNYATNWETLRSGSGLAAFGDEYNLLECVSTYIHEVASLNAASVYSMRCAADIAEMVDEVDSAASKSGGSRSSVALRSGATDLVGKLQELYAPGRGFWHTRMPDGTMKEVRHVFDLLTVLNSIPNDLTADQQSEMVKFFQDELRTDTWMRALSAQDEDVLFSIRPDHQWTGAYAAWPSETAKGLCRINRADLAADWMRGLVRSANQGPFAQAHMADGVLALESGGAIKSSPESPYINDWHSSSSGSWVSMVIEGLFGVHVGPAGVAANPQTDAFDADARLTGLTIGRRSYSVDGKGIHEDPS